MLRYPTSKQLGIKEEILSTITLDIRKNELISQLHQLTQGKLKSLAAQRDQIETIRAQLNRYFHSMRETSNQGEGMLMKITAARQMKELTTSIKPGILEPNTEADMTFFVISADGTTDCQNNGLVVAGSLPFKCQVIRTATVGEKSTAVLKTVDFNNQSCKVSMTSITCELVSNITGTRASGGIERRGLNTYEINYQPTIKGRHQLYIKVKDQHIRGSPFPVSARSPVEKLGTPILTMVGLRGLRV